MLKLRHLILHVFAYLFKNKFLKALARKTAYVLGVFMLIVLLRVFVFEIYRVESKSIEKTLYAGDIIWVNKLGYGARLPMQPVDIPFLEALAYVFGFYTYGRKIHIGNINGYRGR